MPLLKCYGFWNNKGGVGKSTLCFHTSDALAKKHPDINVLVIDADPQASVTSSFLGGDFEKCMERLQELDQPWEYDTSGVRSRTLTGALVEGYQNLRMKDRKIPAFTRSNVVRRYAITPRRYQVLGADGGLEYRENTAIKSNLYLLCGHPNVEVVSNGLLPLAFRKPESNPDPSFIPDDDSAEEINNWPRVMTMIKAMCDQLNQDEDDWVIFFDMSPSFHVYTMMAVAAADHLIVPITPDPYSTLGSASLLQMIYGIDKSGADVHEAGKFNTVAKLGGGQQLRLSPFYFCKQAKEVALRLPTIRLLVGNKLEYKSGKLVKTHKAIVDSTLGVFFNVLTPDNVSHIMRLPPEHLDDFRNGGIDNLKKIWFREVKDFSGPGIAAAAMGRPASEMNTTYVKVTIGGSKPIGIRPDATKFTAAIEDIVNPLSNDIQLELRYRRETRRTTGGDSGETAAPKRSATRTESDAAAPTKRSRPS